MGFDPATLYGLRGAFYEVARNTKPAGKGKADMFDHKNLAKRSAANPVTGLTAYHSGTR
jgi:hypothetical protein